MNILLLLYINNFCSTVFIRAKIYTTELNYLGLN